MSLEIAQKWNDPASGYRGLSETFCPPFLKLCIYFHVKWFLGRWGFGECIRDVTTNNNVAEGCRDGPCESVDWLFHTGSVGFGQTHNFAESIAAIAGAPGFGIIIQCDRICFEKVCPYPR